MKKLQYTSQFKKDVKRIRNNKKKMSALDNLLEILKTSGTVPQEYNPHPLKGNYKGHMECHVENDFLLIWIDEEENIIKLIRLGSHSELFG